MDDSNACHICNAQTTASDSCTHTLKVVEVDGLAGIDSSGASGDGGWSPVGGPSQDAACKLVRTGQDTQKTSSLIN